METAKIRIQAFVDQPTFEAISKEATDEHRAVGPHVSHLLVNHVAKKKQAVVPKQEYEAK